jgi:hypothetical protein
LFISISSCKKNGTTDEPTVDLSTGTWRISYFWDVQDKTSGYSSYYFMFQSDGTIMAHGSSSMFTGTWSQTNTRININFSNAPLNDLNGDWLKTELNNNSIKLKDDSASQDDQLYFIKN